MRSLIFTADEEFRNVKGEVIWRPSENVVYEFGYVIIILRQPARYHERGDGSVYQQLHRGQPSSSFEKDQLEAKAMDVLKELKLGFADRRSFGYRADRPRAATAQHAA